MVPFKRRKTSKFQILFRPPGCLQDLGAAASLSVWLSPAGSLVLTPHQSLAGMSWGCIYLQGQVGGLSAAPPTPDCALCPSLAMLAGAGAEANSAPARGIYEPVRVKQRGSDFLAAITPVSAA